MRISQYCPMCKEEWRNYKRGNSTSYPTYLKNGPIKHGYSIVQQKLTDDGLAVTVRWNVCGHRRIFMSGQISNTADGYRMVNTPHGYVPEHRFVWEQANGKLPNNHVVHHINGRKYTYV